MSRAGATEERGFFTFYREYTHTGIHAASTAGLTAFGLLTFVHRAFVILAIGVYVLPPIYLYLTRDDSVDTVEPSEPSDPLGTDMAADPPETTGSASDRSADSSGMGASGGTSESLETERTTDPQPVTETARADSATDRDRPQANTDAAGDGTNGSASDESDIGSEVEPEAEAEGAGARAGAGTGTGTGLSTERADEKSPKADVGTSTSEEIPEEAEADIGIETGTGTGAGESTVPGSAETDTDTDIADDGRSGTEEAEEPTPREWIEVDSPTEETLFGVVAAGPTAYAVGSDGVLLAREGDGTEDWRTVLDHGPSAESNTLRGVDATDDGDAIWFTGDSGALARYDVEAGRHTDHSAPNGITDNWADVAVTDPAGGERIALVNGSGQVLAGEYDGGAVEWGEATKPGSGSSMSAIEFVEGAAGYCCDTNSGVYETSDGERFERIGVDDGGSFTAIAAAGPEALAVSAADGTVHRYDGSVWTRLHAADTTLNALATDENGTEWIVIGDGGTIRELADGGWEERETPIETALNGVAVGGPSIAVGAEGTVLERRPVEDAGSHPASGT